MKLDRNVGIGFAYFALVFGLGFSAVYMTGQEEQKRERMMERHENVVGGPIEDTFVEINGVKYFSKIDGLPVETNYNNGK